VALKTGAVRHYDLTLTGSAQNIATVLIAAGTLSVAEDGPYQQVTLYSDDGNSTHVVYVGGDSGVASTSYGVALDTEESYTFGPLSLSAQIRLRDIWVNGTNNDKLRILVITY
jgi:hypothetical protein